MKDNNTKAFDKVDLISPVDLLPIQGIEAPFDLPSDEKKKDGPGISGETKKKDKAWYEDRSDNGEYQYSEYQSSDNTNRYNGINIDPARLYQEEEALRKKLAAQKKKKITWIVAGIVFSIAVMMTLFTIMRAYIYSPYASKNWLFSDRIIDDYREDPEERMLYQIEDTYGTLDLNTEYLNSERAEFNPHLIEYTNTYERCLYFRVKALQERIIVTLNVEMIDKNGNKLAESQGVAQELPMGAEGIVPVMFQLNPYMDLNGVVYMINEEVYPSSYSPAPAKKVIEEVKEKGDTLYVTLSGGSYTNKSAYVVFFKNGQVVDVQFDIRYEDTDKVVLEYDLYYPDYDNYIIYY